MRLALPLLLLALRAVPAAAQDRWQLTLHSDSVLWDLELVGLSGDSLVVRQTDTGATLRLPLMQIDELRLVAKAVKRANERDARATENTLMGSGDLVFRLTLRDRAERLQVVREILARRSGAGP
ncbi:MAG TPA: hypothetical protein VFI66_06290 [Gemmatimonadales bacterium]|nr:hypothetical protein [Gemmatimonadales bacterium]